MKTNSVQKNRKAIFRKFKFLLVPILGIFLIGLTQCEQDSLTAIENEALGFDKNGASPLLTVDYEIENITRMTSDANVTEPIDIAVQTPVITKQHVTMELYNDGSIKLTTVDLPTSQEFNIPHQTLPDYTPKPQKTVAYADRIVYYGENNEILYTADKLPLPTAPEVATQIQALEEDYSEAEVNEAISSMQTSLYANVLQDFIDSIGNYNGTVTNLGEGLISVEIPAYHFDPTSSDVSVLLIDKTKNLLLAARLYDENNNWKSSTMLRYSGGQSPMLIGMKTSVSDVLPTGINVTMQTVSTISNLTSSVNL